MFLLSFHFSPYAVERAGTPFYMDTESMITPPAPLRMTASFRRFMASIRAWGATLTIVGHNMVEPTPVRMGSVPKIGFEEEP